MPAAIDIETATRVSGSICAIGAAVTDGGQSLSKRWLVKPAENTYESMNCSIHGIWPEDTQAAPTFAEVWPEVIRFLAGARYVVAHNAASAERRHLGAALVAARLRPPTWQLACTLKASRELLPRRDTHTLVSLAELYGIELRHHDPESDAMACAVLATKLGLASRLSAYAIAW